MKLLASNYDGTLCYGEKLWKKIAKQLQNGKMQGIYL